MQPIPQDVIDYARAVATYNGKFSPEKYADMLASPMPRRTGRIDGAGDPEFYEAYAKESARYWTSPDERFVFQTIFRQMVEREDGGCSAYMSRERVRSATGISTSRISAIFQRLKHPPHGVSLLLCQEFSGPNREHVFELVRSPRAFAAKAAAAREVVNEIRPKVARHQPRKAATPLPPTPDPFFERFWSVYPNPTGAGRGSALHAWQSIGQNGPDESFAEKIIAAAQAYANSPKVQHNIRENHPEFITAPANWLRGGKWDDAPTPAARPRRPCNGHHNPPCPDDVHCTRLRTEERNKPGAIASMAVGAA